jgi:hypothetical protein
MQILKPIGDGLGTAAGVAWPTFGLISGALSMTIAGPAAIVLGAITAAVYVMVAIPVMIWSFRETSLENNKLIIKSQKQTNKLEKNLRDYLAILVRECRHEAEIAHLQHGASAAAVKFMLLKTQSGSDTMVNDDVKCALKWLLKHKKCDEMIAAEINAQNKQLLADITKELTTANAVKSGFKYKPSISHHIKTGIKHFASGFGALAGCSAGTVGMLLGIGLLTTGGAMPLVCWILFGASLLFGIAVGTVWAIRERMREKELQTLQHFKAINQNLEQVVKTKQQKLENIETCVVPKNPGLRALPKPEAHALFIEPDQVVMQGAVTIANLRQQGRLGGFGNAGMWKPLVNSQRSGQAANTVRHHTPGVAARHT